MRAKVPRGGMRVDVCVADLWRELEGLTDPRAFILRR